MKYINSVEGVEAHQLAGFFQGWPNPPSQETHLTILRQSSHIVLAIAPSGEVVGFTTAISDGVLSAYISLLEVLPTYRRQGIGTSLVRRLLEHFSEFYSVSLHCDTELEPFYNALGLHALDGMATRNYSAQSGCHAT